MGGAERRRGESERGRPSLVDRLAKGVDGRRRKKTACGSLLDPSLRAHTRDGQVVGARMRALPAHPSAPRVFLSPEHTPASAISASAGGGSAAAAAGAGAAATAGAAPPPPGVPVDAVGLNENEGADGFRSPILHTAFLRDGIEKVSCERAGTLPKHVASRAPFPLALSPRAAHSIYAQALHYDPSLYAPALTGKYQAAGAHRSRKNNTTRPRRRRRRGCVVEVRLAPGLRGRQCAVRPQRHQGVWV